MNMFLYFKLAKLTEKYGSLLSLAPSFIFHPLSAALLLHSLAPSLSSPFNIARTLLNN